MALGKNFKEAFADRYEAIVASRVNTGEYKVADLVQVFGSKRAVAEQLAAERGIKLGSAQKALTRLERYERGERGGDVRSAEKVKADIQKIAIEKLPEDKRNKVGGGGSGGSSGMGGGTLHIAGMIGVAGEGEEYEEDRDIDYSMDDGMADEMAILAWEQGEAAATVFFDDMYGFENMYVVDADILFE